MKCLALMIIEDFFSFPTHVKTHFHVFSVHPSCSPVLSECVVLLDKGCAITLHKHFSLTMPLEMLVIQEPD